MVIRIIFFTEFGILFNFHFQDYEKLLRDFKEFKSAQASGCNLLSSVLKEKKGKKFGISFLVVSFFPFQCQSPKIECYLMISLQRKKMENGRPAVPKTTTHFRPIIYCTLRRFSFRISEMIRLLRRSPDIANRSFVLID